MLKNHLLISSMCLIVSLGDLYAAKNQPAVEKETPQKAQPEVKSESPVIVKRQIQLIEFLQKAYDTNPELLSTRYSRSAKEGELLAAMSKFGPNVRLSATAGHQTGGMFNPTDKNLSDHLELLRDTKYDMKGQVSASLNLFRGGADTFELMGASARQEMYDLEQLGVIQKFILDAVESYVNVLKGRQSLEVYTKFERQARHNFERVQTEYIVGSSTRTNVLSAKAELAQATSNRMKAQTELINAEQVYIEMAGEPAGELTYPQPMLKLPSTLDECMHTAETKSLTLRKGAAGLRAARYNLASSVTGTFPSIDLYAEYETSLKDEDKDKGGSGRVGVRLSYELFSNSSQGSQMSKLKQAIDGKQAATYGHEHSRNAMIKEVKAAWHGLKTAESQRSQSELGLEAARNAYDGAVEEFRLGQRAYLDLLKVQEQLLKSELNYLEAVKADILGRYRLLGAIGELTPSAVGLVMNNKDDEDN